MFKQIVYLLLATVLLCACTGKKTAGTVPAEEGSPVPLLHAQGFTIAQMPHYTTVTVYNPWKAGEVYATYYLVKNDSVATPTDGQKVRIPIQNLVVNSATHLGFLEMLGELDKISGVSSADYIYNPIVRKGVAEGHIQNLGDAFNLDIEKLLLLHPQAVMTTAYNADDENSKRMKQTGLTLLYNIEWQEKTLLGRAEWIKFVGAFFDKTELAATLYSGIEREYNETRRSVSNLTTLPSILSGQDYRGTWSMPGGRSYSAQLFHDAAALYNDFSDTTSGSIASSIEMALVYFSHADIWVGAQASTLKELEKMNSKYKLFDAFQKGNVYNTNKRMIATGGNDYWESGVARPDLLLKDMVKICHPQMLPLYELTYMERLQ